MYSMLYASPQAIPSEGEIACSETSSQEPAKESNHSPENNPDTQDAKMKDAPSCKECGQIFPWNQPHLRWKHKCSGSPESSKQVSKPSPTVAKPEDPAVAMSKTPTTYASTEQQLDVEVNMVIICVMRYSN